MKQLKDTILEKLVISKNKKLEEYYFHKEIGVVFNNKSRMRLYTISTSEDPDDIDSWIGFIIKSPYELEVTDTLGREYGFKSVGALPYADIEIDKENNVLEQYIEKKLETDKDECYISFPGQICDSLSMQLPKVIAEKLVGILSELYNRKFFKDGFFQPRHLKPDWYIRKY